MTPIIMKYAGGGKQLIATNLKRRGTIILTLLLLESELIDPSTLSQFEKYYYSAMHT